MFSFQKTDSLTMRSSENGTVFSWCQSFKQGKYSWMTKNQNLYDWVTLFRTWYFVHEIHQLLISLWVNIVSDWIFCTWNTSITDFLESVQFINIVSDWIFCTWNTSITDFFVSVLFINIVSDWIFCTWNTSITDFLESVQFINIVSDWIFCTWNTSITGLIWNVQTSVLIIFP